MSNPKWATVNKRIEWLVTAKYAGNRSALARAIGFSHTLIADVVRGRKPGRGVLNALQVELNVNPEWLHEGVGQPFQDMDAVFNVKTLYKILYSESGVFSDAVDRLTEEVQSYLNIGWTLDGGVSLSTPNGSGTFKVVQVISRLESAPRQGRNKE